MPSLPIFRVRILTGHMFILPEAHGDSKEMHGVEAETPKGNCLVESTQQPSITESQKACVK